MGYNDTRTIPRNRHSPPYRKMPRAAPAMFLYHILEYDFPLYSCRQIINCNSYSAPLLFSIHKRKGKEMLHFSLLLHIGVTPEIPYFTRDTVICSHVTLSSKTFFYT